ncbi:hypothetical protein FE257_002629 [Aspergillus nanangensis]|uniref:Uncharacterized protein n=1 Tax=Aspergillus nanangensis TaxID=2582783 RepID=A0AAD4GNZ4_ASPNN|nr:hypothetical protein FE257_002629 [Aspergillus nanangensis]
MDYRSDRLSTPADAFRPSASSTSTRQQRWSQLTPSSSCPAVDTAAGPSHLPNPRHYGGSTTALDDSARAHRTTALRQLNGNAKPLTWKNRQPKNPTDNRSSTLASQPVLVRSYSGGPDETSEPSKMPSRRSFLFIGSSSSSPRRTEPELPSEQDFSIDAILRAIEPNIRGTLDSIGEICGRSKLSLANEYGSHIAPLGEIRAPPGGLVTVEETSPDHEQPTSNNVAIYDDENSVADGPEYTSFPLYGYVEARQAAIHHGGYQSMMAFSVGDGTSVQAQPPDTPRSYVFNDNIPTTLDPAYNMGPPHPITREFASQPQLSGRDLLARSPQSRAGDQIRTISTPPLVSEVLLDAQADGLQDCLPGPHHVSRMGSLNYDSAQNPWTPSSTRPDSSVLTDVQALFGWLGNSTQDGEDCNRSDETAEARLRATLQHQRERESVN